MSLSRLVFFPAPDHQILKSSLIISTLKKLQFIETMPVSATQYLAGERFLNLLSFLGCSPNINLIPVEKTTENTTPSDEHCCISILQPSDSSRCLGFTQHAHPKCPECKKRIAHWKSALWQQADEICICDKCQTATPYGQLNWKHECGYGRCGFEITHIYPHEALPTDQLLSALTASTGTPWQYCYAS